MYLTGVNTKCCIRTGGRNVKKNYNFCNYLTFLRFCLSEFLCKFQFFLLVKRFEKLKFALWNTYISNPDYLSYILDL